MSKRYDVCAPRNYTKDGEEKTFWHRVGTAFEGDKGIGINFDSLPLPDKEGRVSVRLFEPREKQQGAARAGADQQETASAGRRGSMKDMAGDMNDSIPF